MAATNDWYEDFDDAEDRTVKDIIRSAIEHNDQTTFLEAGQRLDRIALQQGSAKETNGFITGWLPVVFVKAASLTPHDSPEQDNLVALLASLQRLPGAGWQDLFGYGFRLNISEVNDGK